jgi:hypothetical protein
VIGDVLDAEAAEVVAELGDAALDPHLDFTIDGGYLAGLPIEAPHDQAAR